MMDHTRHVIKADIDNFFTKTLKGHGMGIKIKAKVNHYIEFCNSFFQITIHYLDYHNLFLLIAIRSLHLHNLFSWIALCK